jgi:hypothetical protein
MSPAIIAGSKLIKLSHACDIQGKLLASSATTHKISHTHTHTLPHTHARAGAHAHTHARTHTHTQAHTYT